jgi:hypothetical protein
MFSSYNLWGSSKPKTSATTDVAVDPVRIETTANSPSPTADDIKTNGGWFTTENSVVVQSYVQQIAALQDKVAQLELEKTDVLQQENAYEEEIKNLKKTYEAEITELLLKIFNLQEANKVLLQQQSEIAELKTKLIALEAENTTLTAERNKTNLRAAIFKHAPLSMFTPIPSTQRASSMGTFPLSLRILQNAATSSTDSPALTPTAKPG